MHMNRCLWHSVSRDVTLSLTPRAYPQGVPLRLTFTTKHPFTPDTHPPIPPKPLCAPVSPQNPPTLSPYQTGAYRPSEWLTGPYRAYFQCVSVCHVRVCAISGGTCSPPYIYIHTERAHVIHHAYPPCQTTRHANLEPGISVTLRSRHAMGCL